TADCFTYEDPIRERRTVMRALRANSEPVRRDVREKNRFSERMAGEHLASPNTADLDPLGEVGTSQLVRMFAHFRPLRRLCAWSRCATNAGATFVSRSLSCAFCVAG